MDKYYEKKDRKAFTRDAIIGLGEDSFRKNYYPELQEKIIRLERAVSSNRALIAAIPDTLFICGLDGEIHPISDIGKEDPLSELIFQDKDTRNILSEMISGMKEEIDFLSKEIEMINGQKTYYLEARCQKAESGEILIIIRNMTERILLERKLRYLVERDALTGLQSRRSFEEKMERYVNRYHENLAIVSVDINGLKFINDTLGHYNGDLMIIEVAEIVSQIFGEIGLVARIGGDEFGVFIEDTTEKEIEVLLENMNILVDAHNKTAGNRGLSLASGYAFHKKGFVNTEFIFQEADNNMYQNKLLKKESIRSTFVKAFMKALEVKDFVSEGHVSRMEHLAVVMGKDLKLHQDQMDRLVLLTKFHDIGKIGIPDAILKKPAALDDTEWKVMKTHTSIGERIALEAAEIRDIAHLILKHHERWDGQGYPLGIAGQEIPIECRILSIVDTFDAMTNDRPYRNAMSVEDSRREIQKCSGTQFDPDLVDVFMKVTGTY